MVIPADIALLICCRIQVYASGRKDDIATSPLHKKPKPCDEAI
jgi:hypothetical protein